MNAPTLSAVQTLIRVGESMQRSLRYSRQDITDFARLTGDVNPLHIDIDAAHRAGYHELIASGQHTTSQMMGLAASYFSRSDDGVAREMLCLNFDFAFKHPIHAEQDIEIRWRVHGIVKTTRQGAVIGHIEGEAHVGGRDCVVGRGTVLVRPPSP